MKRTLSLILSALLLVSVFLAPVTPAGAAADAGENGVWLSFSEATDEELEQAIEKIRTEQRARIRTKIKLDHSTLSLVKGKTAKLTAQVIDVPEGVKAGKITWTTSDKRIAACEQGTVRGVANGTAVIKAKCTLSDGTELESSCKVSVMTPVASLAAKNRSVSIGVGETVNTEITVQPRDASVTKLSYKSSAPSVATVSGSGAITGVGVGKATVTASTTDGSKKSVSFEVTVTKKDDRGVAKKDSDGNTIKLLGYKETKGSSYARPESGNIFVLVEFEITNGTREELTVSSILCFTAYCDGYTCDYSFSATMNTSRTLDGTIPPGKKLKGQVGFEVPAKWKELEVHVTPDFWSSPVPFILYHQ